RCVVIGQTTSHLIAGGGTARTARHLLCSRCILLFITALTQRTHTHSLSSVCLFCCLLSASLSKTFLIAFIFFRTNAGYGCILFGLLICVIIDWNDLCVN